MSKENFDFRSIQSFVDACQSLGIAPVLPEVSMLPDDLQKSVIANYKLLIVYKAINNGWTPDWSDEDQYKYFPWSVGFVFRFGVFGSRLRLHLFGLECRVSPLYR